MSVAPTFGAAASCVDAEFAPAFARMARASATPRRGAGLYESFMRHVDVRRVLPMIQAPTLVIHVQDSPFLPIAHGRYLAEHIPGASFHEVPGGGLGPPLAASQAADNIIEF